MLRVKSKATAPGDYTAIVLQQIQLVLLATEMLRAFENCLPGRVLVESSFPPSHLGWSKTIDIFSSYDDYNPRAVNWSGLGNIGTCYAARAPPTLARRDCCHPRMLILVETTRFTASRHVSWPNHPAQPSARESYTHSWSKRIAMYLSLHKHSGQQVSKYFRSLISRHCIPATSGFTLP